MLFSPLGCCTAASLSDCMFCCCLLFYAHLFINFSDSVETNYIKIYPTGLRQIRGVGRTMAVDDHCEISFLIRQRTLLRQTFCWFYPQNLMHLQSPDGSSCVFSFSNTFAGFGRLVAQPGGLNVGL